MSPQTGLSEIGLGTWKNTDPDECAASIRSGLRMGYRHIDTAQYYGNEEYVGRGIQEADVDRSEVMVATKVHPEKMGLNYDGVIKGAQASCRRMGLEYLDLLYVHWPIHHYEAESTLSAFENLTRDGLVKHIGLSNYTVELLEEARSVLDEPIFAVQVEMHPLLPQERILTYAQKHDIWLVAYSPLAQGRVFDIPEIQSVAEKHDISEAQVAIAWLLSKDNVRVIPKATSEEHLRDNLHALEVELEDEDLARIDAIDREERFVDRDNAPWDE